MARPCSGSGKLFGNTRAPVSHAFLLKAAELKLPEAQHALGVMCAAGEGVAQDFQKAAAWFLLAAKQGVAAAQCALADQYATGQGMPQDMEQAIAWYRRAARQNHAEAQVALERIDADGSVQARSHAPAKTQGGGGRAAR